MLADLDKEDVKPAPKPAADEKPAEKPAEDVKPAEKPAEEAKPAEASAETKPVEKPAEPAVKLSPEDAALIAEMRATEQVRREAMDREAKRELEEARDAMMVKRYEEAV